MYDHRYWIVQREQPFIHWVSKAGTVQIRGSVVPSGMKPKTLAVKSEAGSTRFFGGRIVELFLHQDIEVHHSND